MYGDSVLVHLIGFAWTRLADHRLDLERGLDRLDGNAQILGLGQADEDRLQIRTDPQVAKRFHGVVHRGVHDELVERVDVVAHNRRGDGLDDRVAVVVLEGLDVFLLHDLGIIGLGRAEEVFQTGLIEREQVAPSGSPFLPILLIERLRVAAQNEGREVRTLDAAVADEGGVRGIAADDPFQQLDAGESLVQGENPEHLLPRRIAEGATDIGLDAALFEDERSALQHVLLGRLAEAFQFARVLQHLGNRTFLLVRELADHHRNGVDQRERFGRFLRRNRREAGDVGIVDALRPAVAGDAHVIGDKNLALLDMVVLENVKPRAELLGILFDLRLEVFPAFRVIRGGPFGPFLGDLGDFQDTVPILPPPFADHRRRERLFLGIREGIATQAGDVVFRVVVDLANLDILHESLRHSNT